MFYLENQIVFSVSLWLHLFCEKLFFFVFVFFRKTWILSNVSFHIFITLIFTLQKELKAALINLGKLQK